MIEHPVDETESSTAGQQDADADEVAGYATGTRPTRKPIPADVRDAVRSRDGNVCQKCRQSFPSLHLHHVVEVQDGGDNSPDNLICLCLTCHSEWHALDGTMFLNFWRWLEVPPMRLFIRAWMAGLIGGETRERLSCLRELMGADWTTYSRITGDQKPTAGDLHQRRRRRIWGDSPWLAAASEGKP